MASLTSIRTSPVTTLAAVSPSCCDIQLVGAATPVAYQLPGGELE